MKISCSLLFVAASVLLGCGGGGGAEANVPVAPLASAPAPARKYTVRLHRESHVGDKSRAVIDDDKQEHVVTRLLGVPPEKSDKKTHSHLVGTMVVREIGDRKDARRTEITVTELWQTVDGGARTVLAPPGARLAIARAARKEDAQVTVDDRPAPNELREAIDDLLTLTTGGPSDDEIFGSTVPQPIGAEWSPNVALAEKDMGEKGIVARPGGLSGKVKLVGTEQANGAPCLDVQADMDVDGIESIGDLPAGSSILSGRVSAHMRGLFPVDEKLGRMGEEMDVVTRAKMRVPSPKGDVEVDVKTVDRRTATYMPL
ncbi:MAG TPA: hypothetical protein VLM85_09035 [Polyangiaceae bacterium]|nr:hypothetical protein [Polyangiaceae bacterium]